MQRHGEAERQLREFPRRHAQRLAPPERIEPQQRVHDQGEVEHTVPGTLRQTGDTTCRIASCASTEMMPSA